MPCAAPPALPLLARQVRALQGEQRQMEEALRLLRAQHESLQRECVLSGRLDALGLGSSGVPLTPPVKSEARGLANLSSSVEEATGSV